MTMPPPGVPVDEKTCFSDHKGEYKKKLEKKQTKLLAKLAPTLGALLEPDERVLMAAAACAPAGVLEQLTTGWVIFYLKRCVLVVTDRRILQLMVKPNLTPRGSMAEVRYGDLAETKSGSFLRPTVTLRYRNQRTETFTHLESSSVKKIAALVPTRLRGASPGQGGRQPLCPRCAQRLTPDVYRCPHCFLEFKTPEAAVKYSLLFPGGGYFYTGHPLLGVADAVTESVLLIAVVLLAIVLFSAEPGEQDPVSLALVAGVLVLEKLISVFHSRHYVKEYLPVERDFRPLAAGHQPRVG